jgi:hypothetical protein
MRQPVVIWTPLLLRVYVIGVMVFWVGALLSFPIASPSDALLVTVMVAFGVGFTSRMAMVKLQIDESGVVVRNFIRTWRFDGSEIEDFRLGRAAVGQLSDRSSTSSFGTERSSQRTRPGRAGDSCSAARPSAKRCSAD